MSRDCDNHFCYAAKHPGEPGAYAVCVDEKGYEKDLAKFIAREIKAGSVVERVTCNQATALLNEYVAWTKIQDREELPGGDETFHKQGISNHEMTEDQRLDDPRHGQAEGINRDNRGRS